MLVFASESLRKFAILEADVRGRKTPEHNVPNLIDCCSHSTHSLIHHFGVVPNSEKLQTTTEIDYQRILRYRSHRKHCGKR